MMRLRALYTKTINKLKNKMIQRIFLIIQTFNGFINLDAPQKGSQSVSQPTWIHSALNTVTAS